MRLDNRSRDAPSASLRAPISVNLLRSFLQVGFAGRIPFQLQRQPLKPLESFLGTGPAPLLLDVRTQFSPGQPNGASHQVGHDL